MSEKTLRLIRIMPGRKPEQIQLPNELSALQDAVGGYIETVTLEGPGLVVILNEEGRLLGWQPNGILNIGGLTGQMLVGPVLIARTKGDEFASTRRCDLDLVSCCWVPAQ